MNTTFNQSNGGKSIQLFFSSQQGFFFTNMIRLGLPTLPSKRNKQDHYLVAILREQQLWSMEKEGHLMQVKREG